MSIRVILSGILLATLLVSFGCKEKPAAQTAGPNTGIPGAQMPPGHPPMGGSELPVAPGGSIAGEIILTDAVKSKVAAGDAIFVVARNSVTGSVIAAIKVVATAQFPVNFKLESKDVMHAKTSLAGKVKLEARVDKDGDAITKNPGDVVGSVADLITVPATGVKLTLDRIL